MQIAKQEREIKMGEGKWCYSFNEENFEGDFDTKEQAIAEAIWYYKDDEKDQDFIWVGQTKAISLGVSADRVIEELGESAYEQAGEYAEVYLTDVSKEHYAELEDELNKVVINWMEKHKYKPTFFTVNNVIRVEVKDHI